MVTAGAWRAAAASQTCRMLALSRVVAAAVVGVGWLAIEDTKRLSRDFPSFAAAGRHARIVWACYRWVGRVRD